MSYFFLNIFGLNREGFHQNIKEGLKDINENLTQKGF